MSFNIFAVISAGLRAVSEVQVDGAELAAGQAVEVPQHVQVGTTGGKPVYLFGVLTTDANYQISATPPVAASAHTTTLTTPGG